MSENRYDKNAYFEKRDKLMKSLPEPEKSVYQYFRMVEKKNMLQYGKLIVDGISPLEVTAEHFNLEIEEVRQICLRALKKLNDMM